MCTQAHTLIALNRGHRWNEAGGKWNFNVYGAFKDLGILIDMAFDRYMGAYKKTITGVWKVKEMIKAIFNLGQHKTCARKEM